MAVQTSYFGYETINYAKDTLDKFVPTLFIGLGGTGKSTLMRFRKNMLDEYVKWHEDFARFLVVDTDDQNDASVSDSPAILEQVRLRRDQGEFIPCTVTQQEYRLVLDSVRQRGDRRFWEWLHPDFENLVPPQALETGAGTYRQAGRLAFFLRYNAIRDNIVQHIREAMRFAAKPNRTLFGRPGEVYDNRLEVVIVTSLAGGTGSGMFLDMAYLVRDILHNTPDFRPITAHTTLYAVMPSIFSAKGPQLEKRFRQNAYAALLEMEHYTTPRPLNPFGKISETGQQGYLDRPGFRVNWESNTGTERVLTFRPWDTCYLIDNVNDAQRHSAQEPDEVFQMIADYLFLDFGNNPFSIAKRSARSNHTQLTDRLLAEEVVRRVTPASGSMSPEASAAQDAPDVIFENFYGCTYSSFGLSEILIDKERIHRAASYRLAYRLILECWLSSRENHSGQKYEEWLLEDLKGGTPPEGETEAIEFNRNAIKASIIERQGRNLERDLNEKFDELDSSTEWVSARDRLKQTLETLRKEQAQGSYHALLCARRDELLAKVPEIGPLRRRLKLLLRDRFQAIGAKPAQRLAELYSESLDKAAKIAFDKTKPPTKTDPQLLARLNDAYQVGFPVHTSAISMEFQDASHEARELSLQRLDSTSSRFVAEILNELRNYVGSPTATEQTNYTPLWREYQAKADFLGILLKYLNGRFEDTRASVKSNRKQSLVPNWEARDYDALINETLLQPITEVGIADRDPNNNFEGAKGFSWPRAEEQILKRIPTRQGVTGSWNRFNVVEAWMDDYQRNRDLQSAIGETLARCCQELLGSHIKLDKLGNGNVVSYLMSLQPDTKIEHVRLFVSTSAPCMPSSAEFAQNLSKFRPAWRSILGCTPSADERGPDHAAAMEAAVKQASVEATRGNVDPDSNKIHDTRSVYESRLVVVRELGGIPLHAYDRLKELSEAYFHDSVRQQRQTCHTRWRDSFEELPDIELISSAEYDRIQMEVHSVIRGITLQFIQADADCRFYVQVTDPRRMGQTTYSMGSRISRVIKHACSRDDVLEYLRRQWTTWQDKLASIDPIWYAILYNGLQQTLMEFPKEVNYRGTRRRLPLQICLENLVGEIENLLKGTEVGKSYLSQLTRRGEMDHDYTAWAAWYPEVCQRIRETCLQQISPSLPFYTVKWREFKDSKVPTASDLKLDFAGTKVVPAS